MGILTLPADAPRKAALVLRRSVRRDGGRAQELPSGPVSLANGMVVIGTDVSVSMTPQDDTTARGSTTPTTSTTRCGCSASASTADVRLTDRVSILTEIRSENGDAVETVRALRARPPVARSPDRHSGGTHSADVRRVLAARLWRRQSADRLSARLPVPDGGPAGCAARLDGRRAAHARARMAAELSHRLARDRDRACRSSRRFAGTPACRCASGPTR